MTRTVTRVKTKRTTMSHLDQVVLCVEVVRASLPVARGLYEVGLALLGDVARPVTLPHPLLLLVLALWGTHAGK